MSFAVWLFFQYTLKNIPVLVVNLSRYIEMSSYQRNGTLVTILVKKSDNSHVPFIWPIPKENRRNYVEISTLVFVVSFGKSRVMNLNIQVSARFKE